MVEDTDEFWAAYIAYRRYVGLSRLGEGRAAGESVTFMNDGEPTSEHVGDNNSNPEDE